MSISMSIDEINLDLNSPTTSTRIPIEVDDSDDEVDPSNVSNASNASTSGHRVLVVLLSDRRPVLPAATLIRYLDHWKAALYSHLYDEIPPQGFAERIPGGSATHPSSPPTVDLGVSLCLAQPTQPGLASQSRPPTSSSPTPTVAYPYYYKEPASDVTALLDYASRKSLDAATEASVPFTDANNTNPTNTHKKRSIFRRFEHIVNARISPDRNPDPEKENTPNEVSTFVMGNYPSADAFPFEDYLDVDEFFYFDSEYHKEQHRGTMVRVHLNNNNLFGLLYFREPHVHTYKKRVPWREFLKLPGPFLDQSQMFSMFSRWLFLHRLLSEHGADALDAYDHVVMVTESELCAGIPEETTREIARYLVHGPEKPPAEDAPIVISFSDVSVSEPEPRSPVAADEPQPYPHLWMPRGFDARTAVTVDPAVAAAIAVESNQLGCALRVPRSHALVVLSSSFVVPYLRFFEECLVLHGNLYFMKMHTESIEFDKKWDLNDVIELYLHELEMGRNGCAL